MNTFDEEAAKALEAQLPIRLFLDPLCRDFDRTDYVKSVELFIERDVREKVQSATPESETETPPLLRLLAVQVWGKRILIVLDVNHDAYNWDTAHHLSNNRLPVFRFILDKDRKRATIARAKALDSRVNHTIAKVHRLNGTAVHPPYLEDHSPGADPIVFRAPRRT